MKSIIFVLFVFGQTVQGKLNIPLEVGIEPPPQLSETGIFLGNPSDLNPSPELIDYNVNQALWVDFAQKKRWIFIPADSKIDFSEESFWNFPVGTILIKHFRMETSFNTFQNLETRVLVRKHGKEQQTWVGYTYQWEDDEATLVSDRKNPIIHLDIDSTAPGGPRLQEYKVPSRQQCLQCHSSSVGYVRSARTEQLNNKHNDLYKWNQMNLFSKDIGNVNQYKKYAALNDSFSSMEKKAKSYLSVNCSHCHNPNPAAYCAFTGIDLRYNFINPSDLQKSMHLVPGSKDQSEIYKRMISTRPGIRMPYIGTQLLHDEALDMIGRWIDGLEK